MVFDVGVGKEPLQRYRFWWEWQAVIGYLSVQESVAAPQGTSTVPRSELGPTRIVRGADADAPLGANPALVEVLARGAPLVRYHFCTGDWIVDVWATTPPAIDKLPEPPVASSESQR